MKDLTGKELIDHLVKYKADIIDLKKSASKFADVVTASGESIEPTSKAKVLYENNEEKGVLKRTIIANTYNWLDSHGDVHLNGLFAKSINERGKRIPHLHDHKFELGAKVGRILSLAEVPMKWRQLGFAKNGDTMALMMESQIEKDLNEKVYKEYLADQVDQHSVSMQYVKIDLAVNDEDYGTEYKLWNEVFPNIGNKADAEAQGYFWAVSEAKLIEVSAVLLGSNILTPTLSDKFQPRSTGKQEPVKTTPKFDVNELLTHYKI